MLRRLALRRTETSLGVLPAQQRYLAGPQPKRL